MRTQTFGCFALGAALTLRLAALGQPIPLRQATATYSQDFQGQFLASDMLDIHPDTGWAILRDGPQDPDGGDATHTEVFVAETLADIGDSKGVVFVFEIFSGGPGGQTLGLFRFSATKADRNTFADGQQGLGGVNPGDVDTDWLQLVPGGADAIATDDQDQPNGGSAPSLTINGDNTISASGPSPDYARYTIRACTSIYDVTGIRVEVLDANGSVDESVAQGLPTGGPGRGPGGTFIARTLRLHIEKTCYPDRNCDGVLDLFDFLEYVNGFNAHDWWADCDGNLTWDLFDFLCFVNYFNDGCGG